MIRPNAAPLEDCPSHLESKVLVTLSMEGCIAELTGDAREANVRGGLGIYFGDKLEGLKAIGMDKALGCMPLYGKRLVQSIRNGRQCVEYKDVSYEDQPIERVTDDRGRPIELDVWGWDEKDTAQDRQYHAEVYSISRGGTRVFLFRCPEVFDILYPDDKTHQGKGREHRFLQETVFAACVHELFRRMNITPDILHLNEGHVADAAAILRGDRAFDRTAVVYTNHTVVPAGMERFSVDRLTGGDIARARYAMRFPWPSHRRMWRKFSSQHDGRWFIDFSKGAVETCDAANGVSSEHADATQDLFPTYDRKIESILNGSGDSWIMDKLLEAEINGAEPSRETLRTIAVEGKALSLAEVRNRTAGMTDRAGRILSSDGVILNPDLPTIWMIRRMVDYKSQLPILKDIIHVVCADTADEVDTRWGRMNGLKMQVVVGGIAPEGSNEEGWIEEFVGWMQRPDLKGRFVFVPNADTVLLKMQAIGADICINCPLPQLEACGTSDQRTARNGGINIATRSGGPPEYIEDGRSGMLVGPYESNEDFYARAPKDILDKLRQLSDVYYNHNNGDSTWLDMKLESYLASSKVSAAAMAQRYAQLYVRALHARRDMVRNMSIRHRTRPGAERFSDLRLELQDAARGFLYRDPKLEGWTVVAGSPYFDQRQGGQFYNWGRDTMISLPGLCLERERPDLFRDVMKTNLEFVKNGILPNMIGDGSWPRYNSVDASLWLLWAIGKYLEYTGDHAFLDTIVARRFHANGKAAIQDILEEIVHTYRNGIQFEDRWQQDGDEKSQTIRIYMDSDGLISAGNESTQLTWMDVKPKDGGPVTSRHGKAVEINALWYNALRVMEKIYKHKGRDGKEHGELAEKVKSAFAKFWNAEAGCLYDTIDGDLQQGRRIRPNQVFAVALGLLDLNRSRAVMGRVRQDLLTPFGLRTLSPGDGDYRAVHDGEYSYHQGTVWPWLMGAFVEGCVVAYGRRRTSLILDSIDYFTALAETLEMYESVPEVFDGDCDSVRRHGHAKGCSAQAWSVAESLRGLSLLSTEDDSSDKDQTPAGSRIICEMVVRDYQDTDTQMPGLSVAAQELPFLAESGVDCVYLLGLVRHAGNPFDIMDPFDVDQRAGSFTDLDHFLSEAHALGIKVIVDWMANQHVSKKSSLCTAHPDWFLYTDAKDGDYFADKGLRLCTGRTVDSGQKGLVLVSATDEVPVRAFPRRWSSLAQPDLSHPELRTHALEIGRFWLSKGLDGFRIDAALSTFPDKIKENWGLDVEDNLSRLFIDEMRKIKADCLIMFEGFERQEELLQLADYKDCAVYGWRPRNLATDAIRDPSRLPALTAYLKELEHMQHIRDELVNLGPEHDAFDFEDPWARLDHPDRFMLYFLYSFMPGYMLAFNGQMFGRQHAYKRLLEETSPAPRVADADNTQRETGKRLFGLRKEYPQLIAGDYKCLENDDHDVICIARSDEKAIVIGVINPHSDTRQFALPLADIVSWRPESPEDAHCTQDILLLKAPAESWTTETTDNISVHALLQEGLSVGIGPRSCQVIRLRLPHA